MAVFAALATIMFVADAGALKLHRATQRNATKESRQPTETFARYYAESAPNNGRGIWKWNNALDAYQRHFGDLAGKPLSIAEVGVQSGGSLLMWRTVLGDQIQLHGLDINPACTKFSGPGVDITIGDQGDKNMWDAFYAKGIYLDILVDDGGHQPHQCLTTLTSAFPNVHPGGYIAIEDIPASHLSGFFKPAATFLSTFGYNSMLDSVHIYPFLMVVRKGGFVADSPQASQGNLIFNAAQTEVSDFPSMWKAIGTVPPGSNIVLRNQQWTNLFNSDALLNFFTSFIGLHEASLKDTPPGCSITMASVCTNAVSPNSHLQNRVSGVHIYKGHAVIEVPAQAPWIAAVRKGTKWMKYGF